MWMIEINVNEGEEENNVDEGNECG